MKRDLESIFNELEKSKLDFVQLLEKFSKEQQSFKPAESWNMLQVVEHVISSEKGTLEYLKRKTLAPYDQIETANSESESNGDKLNNALISEKRWQAPAVLMEPSGTQSLDNMLIYWNDLRLDYLSFLQKLDINYHHRLVFKHPLAGRLDLAQTLEFLSNHIIHHSYQLQRIAKELA